MLLFVTGGSASGKSEYAEQAVLSFGEMERVYVATMQPFGIEGLARIEKHRKARAGRGFVTVERYTDLAGTLIPKNAAVLLECMSNLVANELYAPKGARENTVQAVLAGMDALCAKAAHVVVVSNEVFSDGVTYDAATAHYIAVLGEVNRELAKRAQRVVEVVYTIPVLHKSESN